MTLLHLLLLLLDVGQRLRLLWLWLLLLWHLHGLLHLTLLAQHVELLWGEVVEIEEGTICATGRSRHGCNPLPNRRCRRGADGILRLVERMQSVRGLAERSGA